MLIAVKYISCWSERFFGPTSTGLSQELLDPIS